MELEYTSLAITVWTLVSRERLYPVDLAHPAEYDDHEEEVEWTYNADDDEVADYLFDSLRKKKEFENYSDDDLLNFVENNYEDLCDEYETELLGHFEEQAREDAEENYEPNKDYDPYE